MDYLAQIGGLTSVEGDRPSLFELLSQESLTNLLNQALKYVVTVYAQKYPRYLLKVVNNYDQFYHVLLLVIENYYLKEWNASFSESFYGLRRKSTRPEVQKSNLKDLQKFDLRISLFTLVVVPFLKTKLDTVYDKLTGGAAFRMLGTTYLEEEEEEEEEQEAQGDSIENKSTQTSSEVPPTTKKQQLAVWLANLKLRINRFYSRSLPNIRNRFIKVYPYFHLGYHLIPFVMSIQYLLNLSDYHNFTNYLSRLKLTRLTSNDLKHHQNKSELRSLQLKLAYWDNQPLLRKFAFLALKYGIGFVKVILPLTLFGLKFLEWWFTTYPTNKSNLSQLKSIPPKPTKLQPHLDGVPIPETNKECPLCRRNLTNPAMLNTGYLFCYPCVFEYVQQNHKCPVTLAPTDINMIRRVYKDDLGL